MIPTDCLQRIVKKMCGRFTLKAPGRIKYDRRPSSRLPLSLLQPRYNIAPSQEVLVISQPGSEQTWSSMRWGLIPSRSPEPKGFINARAETLEVRPSFRESFQSRRCLIPADGFYEWKRNGKSKQPYYFQLTDEAPFAFAGLWDSWERDGATITSCAIITTVPNELLAPIHDRMPVILSPEGANAWLREAAEPAELRELLAPFPAASMKSFTVSKQVNQAIIDEPYLVEPVDTKEEPGQQTLF
jgi:putative SOS response-associated peptidase YedK